MNRRAQVRPLSKFAFTLLVLVGGFCGIPAFAQYTPEGGIQRIRPAKGLNVELFASEPMIVNPISVDVDARGRLWVTEGVNYRKNVKIPPDNVIKVLEDTDGDGKADKSTIFTNDLNASMSVCVAGDRVFVAESPNLYVYEDKDHDLKADGPRKTLLTGFGGKNHDHGLHGLMLGPDHKLYMTVGDSGYDVTGPDGRRVKFQWGGFLRCELDGTGLEEFAVNFRNPFELAVDSFGRVWCSDNDNDGLRSVRICWILEGGNYGWFGRPEPIREANGDFLPLHHWRADQPGFVPYARITGFGSPSGMLAYEGNAFPDLKGKLIHCDPGPREVRAYASQPREGLGFTCDQANLLTSEEDNYFRPVDVCTAPDGAIFVTDWYDGGVGGHNYNDPTRGRIYRVTPASGKLPAAVHTGPVTTLKEALAGFRSPNLAVAFLAREYLLGHPDLAVRELSLLDLASDPLASARRLWLLDRLGDSSRASVLEALKSPESATRAQALRILRRHGATYQAQILELASDTAPEVRTEFLLAVPTFDAGTAVAAWLKLAEDFTGSDRMYLEALKIAARGREEQILVALKLKEQEHWTERDVLFVQILDPSSAVAELGRRLQQADLPEAEQVVLLQGIRTSPQPEAGKAVIRELASTSSAAARNSALDALRQRLLPFWGDEQKSPELISGLEKSLKDPATIPTALEMIAVTKVHSPELGERIVAIAEDETLSAAVRINALKIIAELRLAGGAEESYALLTSSEGPLREQGLKTLTALADAKRIKELFASEDFTTELKQEALKQLAESTHGGVVLFRLVETGQLPEIFKQQAVKAGIENADINVRLLFGKYVPESERPQRLGDQFTPEQILEIKGDAGRGEKIFSQGGSAACNKCHRIKGKGADIGPELSLIGKKYERRALLETIMNPSAGIAPEYYPYVVEMDSGLVYGGFVLENSDENLVLKTISGEVLTLPRKEVVELVKQNVSLMPDAILKDVSAQDAADLLEYLTTLK